MLRIRPINQRFPRNLSSRTIYANWSQNVYTLTYNNQGVNNTTAIIDYGNDIPDSVTPPVRTGYNFLGYYDSVSGGTQYYDGTGARKISHAMTANKSLYAKWQEKQFTITYEGMEDASISGKPEPHTYGTATVIPNPTKKVGDDVYTFMGWCINGGSSLTKNLTLPGVAYNSDITLKANWMKATDVEIADSEENGLKANTEANQAKLNEAFNMPVEDEKRGVTTEELATSASVKLNLIVTDATGEDASGDAIKESAQGNVVKFYDAKVTKEITDASGITTITTLEEIPVTVAITIPLTSAMQGKSSYSVYRYHTFTENKGGTETETSEIHTISSDPNAAEYFEVSGDSIIVHTRMFSTFAIVAGEDTLNPIPSWEGGNDGTGFDVQGRVTHNNVAAVYKLDVAWGAMSYVFTTASEWDPINHSYGEASYAWLSDSFNGINNKITVSNHSNADVNAAINFVKESDQLKNVDVTFHAINSEYADAVTSMYIPKVASDGDTTAPSASVYMWLKGTPETFPGEAGAPFKKVGVITLTFSGDTSTGLTPVPASTSKE